MDLLSIARPMSQCRRNKGSSSERLTVICSKSHCLCVHVFVCSDDAAFLWRLARVTRDVALQPNIDAARKKQLTFEAFEYAKNALAKNKECFAVHKVRHYTFKENLNNYFFQLPLSVNAVVRNMSQWHWGLWRNQGENRKFLHHQGSSGGERIFWSPIYLLN